jgi:hypothetical protein
MAVPGRLYKYLPSRYLDSFVGQGLLLFRNLTHFRKIEDIGRRDLLEGLHLDYPDNPVSVTSLDGSARFYGRAAFINSINTQLLFVFCLSEILDDSLFKKFSSDACVEIINPSEFIRRCRVAVAKTFFFRDSPLLDRGISYYMPNRPAPIDVHNPRHLAFCKHESYADEHEYRLAFALRGAFKQTRRLVRMGGGFSFDEELEVLTSDKREVTIGPISDIVTVHTQ